MTFEAKLAQFIQKNALSDARLGAMLEPKVTGACVGRWRLGRCEPSRQYRRQLIDLSDGYITAEDFI